MIYNFKNMRKQSTRIIIAALLLSVFCAGMYGCKKEEMVTPEARAFFLGSATANYQITAPNIVFKIPVGTTNVEQAARTVNISVSSPTGAVSGTHYNIPATVTIAAGKAIDTLVVAAVYNQYLAGRKDVLEITVSGGVQSAIFSNKVTVNVSGPCFDGNITDINVMSGEFKNTLENQGGYGPYTVTVSNITATGTTGTATIDNLWDYFGPVTINFDWTDPNNTIVSIPLQVTDQEYDVGQPFMIRTSPGKLNKFSVCTQRLSLTVDIIVGDYFGPGQHAMYDADLDIIANR
jgi:hypothetical protein